jgi:hypothetical protein
MESLITNLLDAATIRTGHLSLVREPQDLSALIRDAAETIRPLLEEKSQTLRVEVPPVLRVNGDRERLLQVLSNLLGNAIKFAPREGHITAKATVVEGWAHCLISDDGPGIEQGSSIRCSSRTGAETRGREPASASRSSRASSRRMAGRRRSRASPGPAPPSPSFSPRLGSPGLSGDGDAQSPVRTTEGGVNTVQRAGCPPRFEAQTSCGVRSGARR